MGTPGALSAKLGSRSRSPCLRAVGRGYKIRQSIAQREEQAIALDEVRRQVSLDVWTSYYALVTSKQVLDDTNNLLGVAQYSFTVASRRYESGAGPMIELLNSQSALSNAKRQRVQAWADWHADRLDLASRLGALDLTDTDNSATADSN